MTPSQAIPSPGAPIPFSAPNASPSAPFPTPEARGRVIALLAESGCSCVILPAGGGDPVICRRRGVIDLYELYRERPALLRGAFIADKVVGKGAAAIMVAAGIAVLHTPVISQGALALLNAEGVSVTYGEAVPNIINRSGTGICPVESLCASVHTSAACIPLIASFLASRP